MSEARKKLKKEENGQSHKSTNIVSVPIPSFKTRTIHYDNFNLSFGPHAYSLSRGILEPHLEFGSSTSLDGCYLDNPVFKPGITVAFPLEPQDLPKFYLNPYGQYLLNRCIIDSPTFIKEMEVKCPQSLYTRNIKWAVIHASEQTIESDLQTVIEKWKGSKWEISLTKDSEYSAKSSKEIVAYIRENFTILPEVPVTDFRKLARKIIGEAKVNFPELSKEYYFKKITMIELFNRIEQLERPVHLAIAKCYEIDYQYVKDMTLKHILSFAKIP